MPLVLFTLQSADSIEDLKPPIGIVGVGRGEISINQGVNVISDIILGSESPLECQESLTHHFILMVDEWSCCSPAKRWRYLVPTASSMLRRPPRAYFLCTGDVDDHRVACRCTRLLECTCYFMYFVSYSLLVCFFFLFGVINTRWNA